MKKMTQSKMCCNLQVGKWQHGSPVLFTESIIGFEWRITFWSICCLLNPRNENWIKTCLKFFACYLQKKSLKPEMMSVITLCHQDLDLIINFRIALILRMYIHRKGQNLLFLKNSVNAQYEAHFPCGHVHGFSQHARHTHVSLHANIHVHTHNETRFHTAALNQHLQSNHRGMER